MPQVDLLSPIQQGQQFFENEQRQKFRRQQEFLQLDQQRQAATFQDARTINSLLKSGQIDKALQVTGERKGFINQLSGGVGDTRDTDEIEQGILSGDIAGTINLLDSVDKAGVQGGFLKSTEPSELSQINLEKARIELANLKGPAKINPDFLKEERKVAKDSVVSFNKRASEIRSSFGKVESILGSGELNRMKIASAMTSMARLLSPGIVTNQDFQNLSNSSNPVATLIATLTGKGDDGQGVAENLQRFIDPTNPDLFDKDAFLLTARNVAGAEIPALIDSYNDAKARASRAGISERAINTNFEQNKNFTSLSGMLEKNKPVINHSVLGQVTEGQLQETMKNKNMTREQVLALLSEG